MNNESLLPSNEYREFESRAYVDPNIRTAQTETFIDKLRETQGTNAQEIRSQVEALGTSVPSNLGGLTGSGSYFSSRYTPQANSMAQSLRTAALLNAANQASQNELAVWKKRQQEAYYNYQKRMNDKQNLALSNNKETTGKVTYTDTSEPSKKVSSVEPLYSPAASGSVSYSPSTTINSGGSLFEDTNLQPQNNLLSQNNSIFSGGNVDIQRDRFGNITSLTYGGKTFTGDAAKQRYQWLQSTGNLISGK